MHAQNTHECCRTWCSPSPLQHLPMLTFLQFIQTFWNFPPKFSIFWASWSQKVWALWPWWFCVVPQRSVSYSQRRPLWIYWSAPQVACCNTCSGRQHWDQHGVNIFFLWEAAMVTMCSLSVCEWELCVCMCNNCILSIVRFLCLCVVILLNCSSQTAQWSHGVWSNAFYCLCGVVWKKCSVFVASTQEGLMGEVSRSCEHWTNQGHNAGDNSGRLPKPCGQISNWKGVS